MTPTPATPELFTECSAGSLRVPHRLEPPIGTIASCLARGQSSASSVSGHASHPGAGASQGQDEEGSRRARPAVLRALDARRLLSGTATRVSQRLTRKNRAVDFGPLTCRRGGYADLTAFFGWIKQLIGLAIPAGLEPATLCLEVLSDQTKPLCNHVICFATRVRRCAKMCAIGLRLQNILPLFDRGAP